MIKQILTAICALHLAYIPTYAAAERPNIILIMGDDMGISDIGCYGSEIKTPNLDNLAEGGLRFRQFYNTSRCCPTRASLLTGLYPHQAGIGDMMDDLGMDGYRGELNRNSVTIAEVLKTAGYRTYVAGKWHVTKKTQANSDADRRNWPLQRGFDRFYGTIHGAGSFFDPNSLTRDNSFISPFDDPEYQSEEFYYTDAISDHAVRFVQEHHQEQSDSPFFMYVAYTSAHWPMHARKRDIAKYKGQYDAGYDVIRKARYEKMINLGLIDSQSAKLSKLKDSWKETDHLKWDIVNMEVYAAMIDNMDQGIGRIVKSLKETGQYENTLLLFFQDNGGSHEGMGRGNGGAQRQAAPSLDPLSKSYLQLDMIPKQTRDGFPIRQGKGVTAGPEDTYIGYGKAWATVSNTPFREYKHWVHEGGISTPLIAHWPAKIRRKGEWENTPSHLIDLMATCVDVAGAEYPATFHGGKNITPMEGKSLRLAFEGKGDQIDREAIYWEHEGNRAIRSGNWKLVANGIKGKWELYDISKDRSELNNLAATMPDKVKRLANMWKAYAQRTNVVPWPEVRKRRNEARQKKH
ncbi:MAG: arylsulfatase [Verrucomicrobia bacterium]|nr:arylsulfatase [Verrucomicrobiota bacterium]